MPLTTVPNSITDNLAPPGVVLPYAGSAAPSGWLICDGSAVSRTTYALLFAAISTTYGAGDGSTTFNLPDLRGRGIAGLDNMGGTAANRLQVALSGNTTLSSAVVTGLSSTSGLSVGMSAFGSTLPAGVTIASIDSASQVTLSTGTGVTAGTGTALRFGFLDPQALGASGGTHTHALATPQIPAHTHTQVGTASLAATAGASTYAMATGSAAAGTTQSTGGGQAHPILQPTMALNAIIKT